MRQKILREIKGGSALGTSGHSLVENQKLINSLITTSTAYCSLHSQLSQPVGVMSNWSAAEIRLVLVCVCYELPATVAYQNNLYIQAVLRHNTSYFVHYYLHGEVFNGREKPEVSET